MAGSLGELRIPASSGTSVAVPSSAKLASQASPAVFGHRGGANIVPEETLEGLRTAAALGVPSLEMDVQKMADGSLMVMHDSTVDRTTTSTGNVADWSAARVQSLAADAGSWFGYGWPNTLHIPTFADVLREFGNKYLLIPEVKSTGSGAAMLAHLQRFAIDPSTVLIQSFQINELPQFVSAGYTTMLLVSSADDPSPAVAAGVKWIGCDSAVSTSYVATVHAAGLKIAPYVVDRQSDFAAWSAAGADGVFTNEPLYVTDLQGVILTDPYAAAVPFNGKLIPATRTVPMVFSGTDEIGWGTLANQFDSELQGWAVPALKAKGDTYQIDLSFAADAYFTAAATNWLSVALMQTDAYWTNGAGSSNGYNFFIRGDGSLRIYKVTAGVAAQIGSSTASAALVTGAWNTLRINITPTTVKVTRPDLGSSNVVGPLTDSTFRGLYYPMLCRSGATGRFKDVTIS